MRDGLQLELGDHWRGDVGARRSAQRAATAADDYGAARADTGAHQGNDVFAPFGAPVLAVADAMTALSDGAIVEVDGGNGLIRS